MKNINVDDLKKAAESGNIDSYINKNLPPDAKTVFVNATNLFGGTDIK